ncbi:hypothetical protein [Actinocorallia sp. A-T 12471]|uniref:hypothetical protein n=1 Tax=Actinocorallia sp. A-T 12471 TaxID=3089813 RepID=UPI0029CDE192|nr:hypothetical protein [Actinocorallia sp. A-T 12471]MDX6739543.1 hypothetical protein [Actinocorallia sp. A-T 12471]
MNTVLLALVVVLAAAVAALFVMLLALAREVGRIQVRLGPLGARMLDTGPRVGQEGPAFSGLVDHLNRSTDVGGRRDRPQLVLFTSPTCSTCKSLLPGVLAMARAEKDLDVVLVSDGSPQEHERFLAGTQLGPHVAYLDAAEVGIAYQVGTTPYGIALDAHGVVRAKGLCNTMQQVESLINALEAGVSSVQELHLSATRHAHTHQ